ncbi:MAG: YbaN family protein [Thermoanaerobaculia bacterium]|nr:YbaN family protein [Thermoanaerobaculia bacterium]
MTPARIAWTAAGVVLLGIGIAGVILPLLPGTIFLIGASACFVRGSERMHRWLITHPIFGTHVRAFAEGRKMPVRARVIALTLMWTAIGVSVYRVDMLAADLSLILLGAIGTLFILRS